MTKSLRSFLLLYFFLLILPFIGCSEDKAPEIQVTQADYVINFTEDVPVFSGSNAMAYVKKQVSFGPRNPNSAGHKATLEYLSSELGKYADTLILQNFVYTGYDEEKLDLTNIIGKINPASKNRILLSAHWDCRPRAEQDPDPALRDKPIPGANDGASGVAVLLELAKNLKFKKPAYGIDIVFFDGEDYGKQSDLSNFCIGAKYFAALKPANYNPEFGILLDLVGDKKAEFHKEPNSVAINKKLVNEVWQIASAIGAKTFINREGSAVYDDHIPLGQAGIKTIDIIDAGLVGGKDADASRNYWHTQNDVPENLSEETLAEVGSVLTHLIYSVDFRK